MAAAVDSVGTRAWTTYASFSLQPGPAKFNGAAKFDASSFNGLSHGVTTDFDFSTGDFCVKFWVNPINFNNGNAGILASGDAVWTPGCRAIQLKDTATISFGGSVAGTFTPFAVSTTALVAATYYYIEVSRTSGTTRLFVNGNLEASAADTNAHNFNNSSSTVIGSTWDGGTGALQAFLDDMLVEKGVGHTGHTANYTPPTQPHTVGAQTVSLLHFDYASTGHHIPARLSVGLR